MLVQLDRCDGQSLQSAAGHALQSSQMRRRDDTLSGSCLAYASCNGGCALAAQGSLDNCKADPELVKKVRLGVYVRLVSDWHDCNFIRPGA